jgi:hypothetical protein
MCVLTYYRMCSLTASTADRKGVDCHPARDRGYGRIYVAPALFAEAAACSTSAGAFRLLGVLICDHLRWTSPDVRPSMNPAITGHLFPWRVKSCCNLSSSVSLHLPFPQSVHMIVVLGPPAAWGSGSASRRGAAGSPPSLSEGCAELSASWLAESARSYATCEMHVRPHLVHACTCTH